MIPLNSTADLFLVEQTKRLYRRYQREVVEGLNLCPWAKRARVDGQVVVQVQLQSGFEIAPVLAAIDSLTAESSIEIGLLIFPRLDVTRAEFERFVADVVCADAGRMGLTSPSFALAAFHPFAKPDLSRAERLVPFIRRSPDPTIQLVRLSALERVRKGDPGGTHYFDPAALDLSNLQSLQALGLGDSRESLRERISRANLETVQTLGIERLEQVFESILADQRTVRETYLQKLALENRPPVSNEGNSGTTD